MTENKTPYSHSEKRGPEKRALVQRIFARQKDGVFRTRAFKPSGLEGSAGARWLEARRNPGASHLWTLEEHKTVANLYLDEDGNHDGDDIALKIREIAVNLCFFDALYECALFESTRQNLSETPAGPDKKALGGAHYRAYGEAEGILFDKTTNLPVPVADGVRLDNGVFTANATDIASRSAGNLLEPEDIKTALAKSYLCGDNDALLPVKADLDKLDQALIKRASANSAIAITKEFRVKTIESLQKSVNGLKKEFDAAVSNRFATALKSSSDLKEALALVTALGSLTTAGGIGLGSMIALSTSSTLGMAASGLGCLAIGGAGVGLLGLAGLILYFNPAHKNFAFGMSFLRRKVNKLPDSALKAELLKQAADVNMGFHALWLRDSFKKASEKNSFSNRRELRKSLGIFKKVAGKYDWSDTETATLIEQICDLNNSFDKTTANRIKNNLEIIATHLAELTNQNDIDLDSLAPPQKLLETQGGKNRALPAPE